jgi:integrase
VGRARPRLEALDAVGQPLGAQRPPATGFAPKRIERITPDDIEQLGAAAASDQDRAIFLTAAFTGLRMGELIALPWGDVDFETEALHVYGSYSLGTLTARSPA